MPLLDSVRSFVLSPTELKVKQATDEDENAGATGTLMNEISVLTYSPKTLKEIVQVIRKRLTGHGKKSSHKNCIHILKTLTLVAYLVNNGSSDFIAWARGNLFIMECLKNSVVQEKRDEKIGQQIQFIAQDLCTVLKDDELLEQRRKDVIQFRSSISSPGRKSTDNSHLKKWLPSNALIKRATTANKGARSSVDQSMSPTTLNEYQFTSNSNNFYQRGITSLDLKRRSGKASMDRASRFPLDPLEEEDMGGDPPDTNSSKMVFLQEDNPFS
ncbi:hypothetical protein HG535_0H03840 [Zygotorulaspora mrakii]|uniref:ENTH domain-containing protein n=1 Tax=Zygotorulaspora mrakii TaxID=42260 RepID=A0A7H9B8W5_ZYGMR|nr:uncharacterized protein HG535_0H03840 [Zygotorulaspora mrakii]QLG75057.1 hypothetical protein HG535_0H03840 [Zygotorulaspora mrakii]